ncbi:PBP1A family penicillin-binding protein [Psychrosphaera aestuarii]
MIFGTLLSVFLIVAFYFYVKDDLPNEDSIRDVRFQIPMRVYTAEGELISQFGEKRRDPVLYSEIPQALKDAIIATEDSRFYDHFGIDPIGVVRSALVVISTGRKAQGASTITMQLARNVFLSLDKRWMRKIKEIYIALHIEQIMSKEEILTLYLNKIPFGNRAFGIGAAAQVYYGKDISELTLPQLAMIAGIPKATTRYNPIRNPDLAKWRRNVVLGRMFAVGAIDEQTYEEAKQAPITAKLHGAKITAPAPYVAEQVRKEMVDRYGLEKAYTEGFNVYTTINGDAQIAARKAVRNNIHSYDERHGYRGPTRFLWDSENIDSTSEQNAAWDSDKIVNYLSRIKDYGDVIPAVVTNVMDNSVYVLAKGGKVEVLDWDNLKWARPYINDNKQGDAPEFAAQILKEGSLIWLRQNDDLSYRLSQKPLVSSSLVAMNPNNGDVIALVGGYDFAHNQYNRITQAKRQIGSNIKPFVYSGAIENGTTLATLINDAPITKWERNSVWRPANSPETYNGPTRVRRGLAESKNVMAVRVMRTLGVDKTVEFLTRFGFAKSDLPENETISLGSAALTPLSVVTGISTFANGGFLVEPNLIERIETVSGEVVYQATKMVANLDDNELTNMNIDMTEPNPQPRNEMAAPRVISTENAFLISEALNSSIWGGGTWSKGNGWNGTSWRAQKLKRRDFSGKTGTTNDAADTWFTGFNDSIVATTWVGFDAPGRALGRTSFNANLSNDEQESGAEAGAVTALPGWIDFISQISDSIPVAKREIPEGIVSVRIDRKTGLLSRKTDHTTEFEYFIKGTEPTKYVDEFSPITIDEEKDIIDEEEGIF